MTKDVLITIAGLHYDAGEASGDETEPIEVTTPGMYYFKNGKHYLLYEEPVEGTGQTVKNESLEIFKSGANSAHMLFEKDKIHVMQIDTPYGALVIGTYTQELKTNVTEEQIDVYSRYEMDVSGDKIADCEVRIKIEAKLAKLGAGDFLKMPRPQLHYLFIIALYGTAVWRNNQEVLFIPFSVY